MHHRWGKNRSPSGKTCASNILSTTNSARNGLEMNPGLRSDRPTTKRLRHGTSMYQVAAYSSTNSERLTARRYAESVARVLNHFNFALPHTPSHHYTQLVCAECHSTKYSPSFQRSVSFAATLGLYSRLDHLTNPLSLISFS